MVDKNAAAAAHTVGERLRQVRLQRQLHLSQIPDLTRGEFNASAVSQYERGRRPSSASPPCAVTTESPSLRS